MDRYQTSVDGVHPERPDAEPLGAGGDPPGSGLADAQSEGGGSSERSLLSGCGNLHLPCRYEAKPRLVQCGSTSYSSGDGGILEQVKLTENAYCYGKIDINMLCSDTSINKGYQSKYDDEMGQVLFNNIRYGQEISKFETETTTGTALSFSSGSPLSQVVTAMTSSDKRPFASRTQFLDWTTGGNSLANAFGAATLTSASDAQLEEIVGKTINLLKAEPSASNVIQFIVVAQTIRDLSGTVARVRPDDAKVVTRNCAYGQFDVARYIDKDGSKITSDASGNISNDAVTTRPHRIRRRVRMTSSTSTRSPAK